VAPLSNNCVPCRKDVSEFVTFEACPPRYDSRLAEVEVQGVGFSRCAVPVGGPVIVKDIVDGLESSLFGTRISRSKSPDKLGPEDSTKSKTVNGLVVVTTLEPTVKHPEHAPFNVTANKLLVPARNKPAARTQE
jgi:hypothetical protein